MLQPESRDISYNLGDSKKIVSRAKKYSRDSGSIK